MRRLWLLMPLVLSGCGVVVHQVAPSGWAPYADLNDHIIVQSSAEQTVLLGLDADTHYVDLCWEGLKRKCPRGNLTGITVETSTKLGFLSWTNRVVMRGVCAEPPPPPPPPPPPVEVIEGEEPIP